jgi:hypothetical protein
MLRFGGVLIFVIPFERFSDCVGILAGNFTGISAFRLTDAESIRLRQIGLSARC